MFEHVQKPENTQRSFNKTPVFPSKKTRLNDSRTDKDPDMTGSTTAGKNPSNNFARTNDIQRKKADIQHPQLTENTQTVNEPGRDNHKVTPSSPQQKTVLSKLEDDAIQNKPNGMGLNTYLKLSDPQESAKMEARAKFASYKKGQVKQLKRNKLATRQFNRQVSSFERDMAQQNITFGSDEYNKLVNERFPGFSDQDQKQEKDHVAQKKETTSQNSIPGSLAAKNDTGLPDNLKSGIENLSGLSMDDVKVYKNSDKPAKLQAHAYTQGTDIHLAPGQEKHLPHEAWHVVQQKQGRVKPTVQLKGENINDDKGLEKEADVMGIKGKNLQSSKKELKHQPATNYSNEAIQRYTGYEVEARIPIYGDYFNGKGYVKEEYLDGFTEQLGYFFFGGLEYGPVYGAEPMGHFTISADHNEILAAHRKLIDLLTLSGFFHPGIMPKAMSSIEYITPPRDETGKSGKELMKADIQKIQSHAKFTHQGAQSGKVIPLEYTYDHILTGIPEGDFIKWVEKSGGNMELFEKTLTKLKNTISESLYIQQTSGVLPEDFTELFESASKRLVANKKNEEPIISEMLNISLIIARETLSTVKEPPEAINKHRKAVEGYLAYIAQYLMADTISLMKFIGTGSTEKNLFAYLPRVSLAQSFTALPEALQKENTFWLGLIDPFVKSAREYGSPYWEKKLTRNDKETSEIFEEGIQTEGEEEEYEESPVDPDLRTNTIQVLTKLFSGKDPKETFQRPLPNLDTPHRDIEKATGQKGIAVEDRYFHSKLKDSTVTIDELDKVILESFQESQNRQLSHVPDKAKNIEKETNEPPDYETITEKRIIEIRKTLEKIPTDLEVEIKKIEEDIKKIQSKIEENEITVEKLRIPVSEAKKNVEKYELQVKENFMKSMELSEHITELSQTIEKAPLDDSMEKEEKEKLLQQKKELEEMKRNLSLFEQKEKDAQELLDECNTEFEELENKMQDAESIKENFIESGEDLKTEKESKAEIMEQIKVILKSIEELKEVSCQDLLKALHKKEFVISDIFLRKMHQPTEVSQDFYFEKARMNLLNSPDISVARFRKKQINPEKLEGQQRKEVEEILKNANEVESILNAVKKLKHEKVSPRKTSKDLMAINHAGELFVANVNQAYEVYEKNKKV